MIAVARCAGVKDSSCGKRSRGGSHLVLFAVNGDAGSVLIIFTSVSVKLAKKWF